jgi:hypothetical protein
MIRLAPILIALSGKKKDKTYKMSVLSIMYKKYKEQLKDDLDMKRIYYELLAEAGIWNALMNFYGIDVVAIRLPSRPQPAYQFQLHAQVGSRQGEEHTVLPQGCSRQGFVRGVQRT